MPQLKHGRPEKFSRGLTGVLFGVGLLVLAFGAASSASAADAAGEVAHDDGLGWRELARGSYESSTEKGAALGRAHRLFMAEVRPALVLAGFGTPLEFSGEQGWGYGGYGRDEEIANNTEDIAEYVWAFYPFPEVQEKLYAWLLQDELSGALRIDRLQNTVRVLLESLDSLEEERVSHGSYGLERSLRYWQSGDFSGGDSRSPASPEERAAHAEKLRFANEWLPYLQAGYDEEAPVEHLVAMQKQGLPAYLPWAESRRGGYGRDEPVWPVDDEAHDGAEFRAALLALWQNRDDPEFVNRAEAIFRDAALVPEQRWQTIAAAGEPARQDGGR